MSRRARLHCRAVIAQHSKSFALASRVLPPRCRDETAAVYAWCRRADDAVDLAQPADATVALAQLRDDLDRIYAGTPMSDPASHAFQSVVFVRRIPRQYPQELLAGVGMDVGVVRYPSLDRLLHYSFRVAGTVGLMMCHVMGVRDGAARRHAAHLGMAMQLTNICRDVQEDWHRDRLYLPADYLDAAGAAHLGNALGRPMPAEARAPVARVVQRLLDDADRFYRSGDRGLDALSPRCAVAVRAARLIYSGIGRRLARIHYDVTRGRVWVPRRAKLALAARAAIEELANRGLPGRFSDRVTPPATISPIAFPEDVLPLESAR